MYGDHRAVDLAPLDSRVYVETVMERIRSKPLRDAATVDVGNDTSHWLGRGVVIAQYDKFHNALVPYPTIHNSDQKCAHFCYEWCIVVYGTGAGRDITRLVYSAVVLLSQSGVAYSYLHKSNNNWGN